nr:phage tail sheath subtilisin-like domain-containing protein [uncultured Holophaga sp.]
MAATFLHGVETVESLSGPVQVQTVKTAVIGLVGTAPVHNLEDSSYKTVNTPVVIYNEKDAKAYFGEETSGFSIPAALRAIFGQGAGMVVVVNVFDPATHVTDSTPDVTLVTAADIIGTTTAGGSRTGLQAFRDCRTLYGYSPKQIIAPGYCLLTGVPEALDTLCGQLRAVAWIDAEAGLTPSAVITARGTTLNYASTRLAILYPHVKALDANGDTAVEGLSAYVAGAQAAKDNDKGYWWSVSNTKLKNVIGLERAIEGAINDPDCEANQLNAAGITTILTGYAMGYRVWGNRSSAFPSESTVDTFVSTRRTADIIEESLEQAALAYMDHPITQALIDQIVLDANTFIRTLQGRGAVLEGSKAFFDSTKNSSVELAAGHLVISYTFLPPSPMERLTWEASIDVNLYSSILEG